MGSIKYKENDSQTYSYIKLLIVLHHNIYVTYLNLYQYNFRNNNKFILLQIKTTSYMESFLPSTTKLWNDLSDFVKISTTLSSFKKHLKEFFSKIPNDLYHLGARRYNIIHCQLRNCSSNLYKDLFDHYFLTHQLAKTLTSKLRTFIFF